MEERGMPMVLNGKNGTLLKAISELKDADYSKSPELKSIYQRLSRGRKQFAELFEKNIKAVMQISSLDLTMQHQTEKIVDISRKVASAASTIFGGASGRSGKSNNQQEELTNTIVSVNTQTKEVYKKIEASQNELTNIKELSNHTIEESREMQKDMDDLLKIITRLNEVISGIDSISLQTNLLALNASIEASRSGEAGRGFAVVAGEIRELAEETQKMTASMGTFVENIKNASQKSVKSASNTINSLENMTDKIRNVWELNNENKQHVSQVNESISSIASVSEEISQSMNQMESQLKDSTDFMNKVSSDLKKAVEPVVDIEKILDDTVKQMGSMTEDAFYHLENIEFAQYLKSAISSHRIWLSNLRRMVEEGTILPLQLDPARCGFGHFYYAMKPNIPQAKPIWDALDQKHQRFHKYGSDVINALVAEEYEKAKRIYREAEDYSQGLISDLETLLRIANGIS